MAAQSKVSDPVHPLPPFAPECRHELRWRPGRPGDRDRLKASLSRDCEQPARMVCQVCAGAYVKPCETSNPSRCATCSEIQRGRVQVVARSPAILARPGTVAFLTLTSPGDRAHRKGRNGPTCSCTPVGGIDVGKWNADQGRRWNRFCQALQRSGLLGKVEYFRAVEVQTATGRNALHEHLLMRMEQPVMVTPRLIAALRALAIEHGYGHELVLEIARDDQQSARLMAHYCAKYVTKSSQERANVPWSRAVDRETGEILEEGPRGYRTWTSSWRWGSSMKQVKAAQRLWALSTDSAVLDGTWTPAPRQSPVLASVAQGQGP